MVDSPCFLFRKKNSGFQKQRKEFSEKYRKNEKF